MNKQNKRGSSLKPTKFLMSCVIKQEQTNIVGDREFLLTSHKQMISKWDIP